MKSFIRLMSFLPKKTKVLTALLIVLGCFSSIFEVVGIASIGPFIQYASSKEVSKILSDVLILFFKKDDFLFAMGSISCALIFISFLLTQSFNLFCYYLAFKKVGFYLSKKVFFSNFNLSPVIASKIEASKLVKLISQDANFNIVHSIYVSGVIFISRVFLASFIVASLFVINPKQSFFVVLFFCSLFFIIYFFLKRKLRDIGLKISDASVSYMRLIHETINTMREIFVWNKKSFVKNEFSKMLKSHNDPQYFFNVVSQLPKSVIETITFISIIVLCLYMNSRESLASFLPTIAVFIVAAYRLIPALQQIFLCSSSMQINKVALDNVIKFLNDTKLKDQYNNKVLVKKKNMEESAFISLSNVNLTINNKNILNKINLKISQGERVAFIGPSGSGKTTCLNILLGLQPVEDGIVDFFISENELGEKIWSDFCSLVSQDIFLLNGSLIDNITFHSHSSKNIDMRKMRDVIKSCKIDFINNYNADLFEKGGVLSGGQKQRVGLARALYKSCKLLALDEATSALDNETEAEVICNLLNGIDKDCAVIMVAHKIHLLKHFDRVIVFENGNIECDGSFDFIKSNSEVYKRLVV